MNAPIDSSGSNSRYFGLIVSHNEGNSCILALICPPKIQISAADPKSSKCELSRLKFNLGRHYDAKVDLLLKIERFFMNQLVTTEVEQFGSSLICVEVVKVFHLHLGAIIAFYDIGNRGVP